MSTKKKNWLKFLGLIAIAGFCLPFLTFAKKGDFPKPVPATKTEISLVDGIAVSPEGNIFISMREHHIISRIDTKGMMTKYAGTGSSGFSGEGGPALEAELNVPAGLAFDSEGNLYVADRENHRVRRIDSEGIITTIAGNGTPGFSGDGGPATEARLNLPSGIAVDDEDNIYIADRSNNRIRVVHPDGTIHTFAGTGVDGYRGDAGPADQAQLSKPFGLALDDQGNLYIADRGNNRIRKINPEGIITTVAGDGGFFFMGDNGPAYQASIAGPTGVAVDEQGNLYIADRNNNRIRMVDPLGMIRTVAGTGQQDYNGDSELARETNLHLPFDVAVDKNGKVLVVDRSHYRVRKIDPKRGTVTTIAGNGKKKFGGDGGPATGAVLNFPHGMEVDQNDNLIFSDKAHYRIRKISPDGIIKTIAGNGHRGNVGNGGPAIKASLYGATSLEISPKGEIFFISPSGFVNIIRRIDTEGIIHEFLTTADKKYIQTIQGLKSRGRASTSEIAVITQFSDIAFGPQGDLYIVDRLNHQIRKVSSKGEISTIAGTGESDYFGDGGPALQAAFRDPAAITVGPQGTIFVADAANNRIRKIDSRGIVTTVGGNGTHKESGDGGPALEAGIRSMDDIELSPSGELHILGTNTHRVRKITHDGKIVPVAGRGIAGYFGDGGPATRAMLKNPSAITFDSKGNLYISDMGNNRIRKVDTEGIMTTYAGTGNFGWGQDGETVEIYIQDFP